MVETAALAVLGLIVGYAIWRHAPGPRIIGAPAICILAVALPLLADLSQRPAPGLATLWLWLLLALAVSDLRCHRLPDLLTGPLFAVALVWVWIGGAVSPGQALAAAGIGAGALWALREAFWRLRGREGLGLGDVKLMAGLGAATGLTALPWITLLAALSALAVAVIRRTDTTEEIPFGSYLAAAGAAVWLFTP